MDAIDVTAIEFDFEATIIYWRGPSPFFYAPMPAGPAAELQQVARFVTYGWGCIPVEATIAGVRFTTSLFPKDGTFLLPLKAAVRRKINVTAGDTVAVEMWLQPKQR